MKKFEMFVRTTWEMKAARRAKGVLALLALLALGSATASPITAEQARKGMRKWVDFRPAAHMNAQLNAVQSVKTVTDAGGTNLFHVVSLEDGGFIVTSTDDRIQPVIAFSDSGTVVEDERNPLWAMLHLDLPKRLASVASVQVTTNGTSANGLLKAASPLESDAAQAQAEWADLLADESTSASSSPRLLKGVASVSDVRVPILLPTKWGQSTDTAGNSCYNLYTPNNYVCGCVATAAAQLMRKHCYPTASVSARTYDCWVNSTAVSKTMLGGTYDWSNMPGEPGSSSTAAQRQAIGKLCYDVGVTAQMDWSSNGSGAILAQMATAYKTAFGYANAMDYIQSSTLSSEKMGKAIYANLDGGYPVLLGICDRWGESGHAIVADGYGYDNSTLYTHLNLGWKGNSDAWYALPNIGTGSYTFSIVNSVVYNVFPSATGDLLTGRVTDGSGSPIAHATVTVSNSSGSTVTTVSTDERGIYAALVTGGQTYYVKAAATGYATSSSKFVSVKKSVSTTITDVTSSGCSYYSDGILGNSWGNDFTLSSDSATLSSIAISGLSSVISGGSATYTCTAYSSDGTSTTVTPTWSISSGSSYASITTAGKLTAQTVTSSQSVTVKASYTKGDVTKTATKSVTIYPSSYTVTYKPGSYGTGSQVTATKTHNVALTLKGAIFTRSGYTQSGWATSDGGTQAYALGASYKVNAAITLYPVWTAVISAPTALDNSSLTFTTGGDANWYGQTATTHDGVDAMRSGLIANSRSTWLQTTVTGAGTISFWWYASSEGGSYDYLYFSIDGTQTNKIGGTSCSWTQCSYHLPEGTHTLTWTYHKDGSVTRGQDAGFLDQVVWTEDEEEGEEESEGVSSFEGLAAGTALTNGIADSAKGSVSHWYMETDDDREAVIADYSESEVAPFSMSCGQPGGLSGQGNHYLDFKTTMANPLWRTVNPFVDGTAEPKAVGNALTFDFLAILGMCDEQPASIAKPTLSNGLASPSYGRIVESCGGVVRLDDKLLVYFLEDEDGESVSLCVQAGALNATSGEIEEKTYMYTPEGMDPEAWNRVSIKATTTGGHLRFSVYFNGTLLTDEPVYARPGTDADLSITALGFDGQGCVDNIVIGEEDPVFANAPLPDGGPYTNTVDGVAWTFTVSGGKATLGTGPSSGRAIATSTSGALTIPSTLSGCQVTSIGDCAFQYCSKLTSVTIPSSVTNIGNVAFYSCSALTSVTIPSSVTSIGNQAFYGCSKLTSVIIPSSVTNIGNYAFEFCHGLTSVTIPSSVTSIGVAALSGCNGLTSIVVNAENPNYASADGALYNKAITKLLAWPSGKTAATIPSSVTSIANCAFYWCTKLTSVTIPSSVTNIGSSVFSCCSALTSVTIPSSVTSIGEDAFLSCSALTSVTIPSSVTNIGSWAFSYCSALTSMTIPSSVTSIGDYAFRDCTKLSSMTIPSSVTSIGSYAFYNCTNLTSVTIPACVTRLSTTFPSSYSSMTNVVICDGVTSIGSSAFYKCSKLMSVSIPSSVTSIGNDTFSYCSALTSVTIPSSVTSIGSWAFYNCNGLTSITIPSSVTNIGQYAFVMCRALTSVTIPSSVTSIGSYVFSGCSALTSVTIPSSVASIGNCAFQYCSKLTSVTIPSSVTSIGTNAFLSCTALATVYVDEGDATRIQTLLTNSGLDCSNITFKVLDPLPELVNPTPEEVKETLEKSADDKLAEMITNATDYAAFRDWAGKVKAADGTAEAGLKAVQNAPHAWLSYALGSATLIETLPTADDIAVETFTPSSESGKFDFTVSVEGVTVGSDAQKENLKRVFGLEGATSLDANGFSASNVDLTFGTPEDGKVKFTAGPNAANATSGTFFMKVKITP